MNHHSPGTAPFWQIMQQAVSRLTERERLLIFCLAEKLDFTEESDTCTLVLPASELEHLLEPSAFKSRDSYLWQLSELLNGLNDKRILLSPSPSDAGHLLLPAGYLNWLAGVAPFFNEHGILCLEFMFSPTLMSFLQELRSDNVRESLRETAKLKRSFSTRLYQLCRAASQKRESGQEQFILSLNIRELKERLGVADKHSDFRNFRSKVLEVAKAEINENTTLNLAFDFIRTGKQISGIHIYIHQKEPAAPFELPVFKNTRKKKQQQPPEKAEELSLQAPLTVETAAERAFQHLLASGVPPVLIRDLVLPAIRGSEVKGYEDLFVQFMLDYFEKKIRPRSAEDKTGSLCRWLSGRPLDNPSLFAKFTEQVVGRKKSLRASLYR